MLPRRYSLLLTVTDTRPGWMFSSGRVVPRAYTIAIDVPPYGGVTLNLSDTETHARMNAPWIELDVVSAPMEPARCVALRASKGIGTREQRLPLAGFVTEATAHLASLDGTFGDMPIGLNFEDHVWEANRSRGRKGARRKVTPELLREIRDVARANPRTPTAAVMAHFGYKARPYTRKLIARAEAELPE